MIKKFVLSVHILKNGVVKQIISCFVWKIWMCCFWSFSFMPYTCFLFLWKNSAYIELHAHFLSLFCSHIFNTVQYSLFEHCKNRFRFSTLSLLLISGTMSYSGIINSLMISFVALLETTALKAMFYSTEILVVRIFQWAGSVAVTAAK